jgi:mannose-6-phosphate isomerase-like protein (cupin superfamily)
MQKWNRFVVVQGQIEIKTNDGVVMLSRGDSCDVKPGESHEFRTREQPCMMVEEMFVQYDESDICRVIVGGRWGPE